MLIVIIWVLDMYKFIIIIAIPGFGTVVIIIPVIDVNNPLINSEEQAIALRPTLSCKINIKRQAGKIADEVIVNITNGEKPRPFIFLDMAS